MVPSKIHPFKNLRFRFHNYKLLWAWNLAGSFVHIIKPTWKILFSYLDFHDGWISSWEILDLCRQLRRLIRQSNTSARARSQIFRRWTSWTWGLSDKVIEVEKLYMVVNCRRWLSWTWWSSWTRWLGWTRCLTKCCTLRLIKWLWRWWRRGQRESDWQWAVILGLVILEEVPHIHNPGPFQLLKY